MGLKIMIKQRVHSTAHMQWSTQPTRRPKCNLDCIEDHQRTTDNTRTESRNRFVRVHPHPCDDRGFSRSRAAAAPAPPHRKQADFHGLRPYGRFHQQRLLAYPSSLLPFIILQPQLRRLQCSFSNTLQYISGNTDRHYFAQQYDNM
ncbi:hypothetical protein BV898_01284 [Hypsibius exemplaris]|uniref:Uncharacterized protein n=1 Tax=Hypsibius exemplaris TaxID=2072580 RepID=A0A1W0XC40_HYPEX|nr:hypothetical protein BV898_01284 [Hypsibius exemplaris]